MKEFYFETPIRNNAPMFDEKDVEILRGLYKKYDGQSLEWVIRSPEEVRRLRANRYYWSILREFVSAHFQTEYKAHEYFTEKYLSENDVLDLREDNFEKVLNDIIRKSSRSRNTVKWGKIDENIVRISYVLSTAVLSKKEFSDLTNNVILEGQELGIEFTPIEKFNEYQR